MNIDMLQDNWISWRPDLQVFFPEIILPVTAPSAAAVTPLIGQIAEAHDLTSAEVQEVIEDYMMIGFDRPATSHAAA